MFADGIAFVCFYDAERVLSVTASFLFTSSGKGRTRVKWKRGRSRKREWRWKGYDMEERKMEMHEKVAPKRNIFGIWGRPLGATAPRHIFLERSFHEQHLPCR